MYLLSFDRESRFTLTEHVGKDIPVYAILSHTWGQDTQEVDFRDIMNGIGQEKTGYKKLYFCGQQARSDGLHYFWVDTCCIDKTNSTQLQEAINSMFRWYQQAARCYVYLSDVPLKPFQDSKWFTRGWTLQELIAPRSVQFFDSDGQQLGSRKSLKQKIHNITGIPTSALQGTNLSEYSVEEKMSWAKHRGTKYDEDKVYSMLGIFDIYMPFIYGETFENAFRRLQEEIDKRWRKRHVTESSGGVVVSNTAKRSKTQGNHSHLLDSRSYTGTPHLERALNHETDVHRDNSVGFVEERPPSMDIPDKDALVAHLYFKEIDNRLTTMAAAQGKTCRWFFTRPAYISWQTPAEYETHGGFLWIKGNPGTGKSTLMKLLFEEADHSTKGDSSQIIISFFFLARGTELERTTTGLYRSLLHQLLERRAELKSSLEWMTTNGARIIQQKGWNEEALKRTLLEAVRNLGDCSLAIFIDALDECNQKQARDMISYLEELCESAQAAGVRLQICLSSRYYPTIIVDRCIEVELERENGHIEDIKQYIKSGLKIGKSQHAESLKAEILQKSCGIFLWVVLVLDLIKQEYPDKIMSIKKIRERLRELPDKLTELFEMILTRDGENMERLQICLKWILFAARPLKPKELHIAIELTLDQTCSGLWDPQELEMDQVVTSIRSSSKGLAEITRSKEPVVQLIHESVRDFLLDKYETQWSGVSGNSVGNSHEILKKCCLTQIGAQICNIVDLPEPLPKTSQMAELRQLLSTKFPFLEYSIVNILYHANLAQRNRVEQKLCLDNFPKKEWILFNNALEPAEIRRYTNSVSLLYLLAERNLADLIHISPRRSFCFEIEDERYGLPLFAALAMGSFDAVKAFLQVQSKSQPQNPKLANLSKDYAGNRSERVEFGRTFKFSKQKDIITHVLEQGDGAILNFLCASGRFNLHDAMRNGCTPLHLAIQIGQVELVRILLQYYNLDDISGPQYLFQVARAGNIELVVPLLDCDISIDATNAGGMTSLSHAAQKGHDRMALFLLQKEAQVDTPDNYGKTPLMYAVANGHKEVVQVLLEHGAQFNLQDKRGFTALRHVANDSCDEIALLLLQKGAQIDIPDIDGTTPLKYAVVRGHKRVVRVLLDHWARVSLQDNDCKTSLWYAAQKGNQLSVDKQLVKRAELTTTNAIASSILVTAASIGHESLVDKLLSRGVDTERKDNSGRTALSCAVKNGYKSATELLLRRGADVESEDSDSRTPLSHAATGDPELVKLLLGYSVQLESRDKHGRTPLSRAVLGNHEVVKLLIDSHADLRSRDKNGRTPLSHCIISKAQVWKSQMITLARLQHQNQRRVIMMQGMPDSEMSQYNVSSQEQANAEALSKIGDTKWETHTKIMEALLEKGAELDSKDNRGRTLLFYQLETGSVEAVKLLLEHGAEIDFRDHDGITPISHAQALRHDDIVELLSTWRRD